MLKTILVVEDELIIRELLEYILSREKYCVYPVANGQEAIRFVEQFGNPALILLDLMMPEMDGFEFLELRKTDPRLSSIPVIVVSAVSDMVECSDVQGSVAKPFKVGDLLEAVGKIVPSSICEYEADCPNSQWKHGIGAFNRLNAQSVFQ